MNPVQYRNVPSYISGGDFSGDLTGATIDAAQFTHVSMTVVNSADGTPVGNIYIQFSNDDSTWVNGSGTATALINGGETNLLHHEIPHRYVRFFWDHSSAGTSSTVSVAYTLKS
jgi:hypothetical protein